ncbi:MAG: shikimate dehydrogenase [Limnochordaceae bacterium]|nr:shikimate dehydrogenase [Limnochordaceae bacterium]
MITGATRVLAVIGDPVAHSLSPVFQNAALQAMGLGWVYVPFQVQPDCLAQAVVGLGSLGVIGCNVTIPHKEAVAGLVDEIDPFAAWIGAVNTLMWDRASGRGRLRGFNTDGPGFLAALREETGYEPAGGRAVLLGAGGAARAIAGQLVLAGVQSLTIVNRTLPRARALVEWLRQPLPPNLQQSSGCGDRLPAPTPSGHLAAGVGSERPNSSSSSGPVHLEALPWPEQSPPDSAGASAWAALQQALAEADLLVQATAYGMIPHTQPCPPLPAAWLHPGLTVYDIVYRPAATALVAAARRIPGVKVANGEGMLIHQGALSLRLWSGREPPIAVMRQALRQALAKQEQEDVACRR